MTSEKTKMSVFTWQKLKREFKNQLLVDFPGGAVDKNLLANAGDTGLIPGPGRFHMPQSS